MAKHSAMRTVPKFVLKAQPEIKKHVSKLILDTLMQAVKVEAVFGEVILSLEPLREEEGPEFDDVSFRQAVNLTPLVRCRDCEYWEDSWEQGFLTMEEHICGRSCQYEKPDFFCADGVRKKGGKEDV